MSDDNEERIDWREFGLTFSDVTVGVAVKQWSKKTQEGTACGIFGCLNEPLTKCLACNEHYCEMHMPYHKQLCQIDYPKEEEK